MRANLAALTLLATLVQARSAQQEKERYEIGESLSSIAAPRYIMSDMEFRFIPKNYGPQRKCSRFKRK